jgi:hypothetical protein
MKKGHRMGQRTAGSFSGSFIPTAGSLKGFEIN